MVELTDYMETRNVENFPQPPGSIQILGQGFNVIANNLSVILLPVLVDTLLWLGPRLNLAGLMQPFYQEWEGLEAAGQTLPLTVDEITRFWDSFNLLSLLRTFPLGVPSLMSASLPGSTPLGAPLSIEGDSWLSVIGWVFVLTVAGWVLGTLYYRQLAQAAVNNRVGLWRALLHSLIISSGWQLFSLMAGMVAVLILIILSLLSLTLANIVSIIMAILVLWLSIPAFFSFHGVFIKNHNAFQALAQSFRLVRYGLPPLGWFALLAIIINQGMALLWSIPPSTSWVALIGIVGHAFVVSSLMAASFIYYYELNNWIERASQWLNSQTTSANV